MVLPTNPNCVGGNDGTININNISNGSGNFSLTGLMEVLFTKHK